MRQKHCFRVLSFRGRTRAVGAFAKHMMLGKVLQTFFARPVAKFIFGGANVMARILEPGILRLSSQCRNAANMKTCLLRKEYGRDTVKTALTSGSGSPLRVASKRSHAEIWLVLSISFALLRSIARPDCHFPPVCSWSWLVLEKPRFAYLWPWICSWWNPLDKANPCSRRAAWWPSVQMAIVQLQR